MVSFVEKHPDARGEMHDLFDRFAASADSTEFKPLLAEIWATWADVETAMEVIR